MGAPKTGPGPRRRPSKTAARPLPRPLVWCDTLGAVREMSGREWPYAPLPVMIPVKGGAFADNDQIKPRLHLHIRFFRDPGCTDAIRDFHTTVARFRRHCRLLDKSTGLATAFPPKGIQAWREYVQNRHALPELREFGALGSRVLVLVPNMLRAGLLREVPAAWSAAFIDHDAAPVESVADASGNWEFGVVPTGAVRIEPGDDDPDIEED